MHDVVQHAAAHPRCPPPPLLDPACLHPWLPKQLTYSSHVRQGAAPAAGVPSVEGTC